MIPKNIIITAKKKEEGEEEEEEEKIRSGLGKGWSLRLAIHSSTDSVCVFALVKTAAK